MSLFDINTFMAQETTEAATRRPPLPPGDYTGMVGKVEPRQWQSKDGTKSGLALDIELSVNVPAELQASIGGLPSLTLRDSLFLDVTAEGFLDWAPGRNSGLRRYREALGQNVPGQPWSPSKMSGQPVTIKVGHRVIESGASAGEITEEVSGVTKA